MADHQRQRIHPVDLEAGHPRPTTPLVPPGSSFRSDKGDPAAAPDRRPPHHQPLPPPKRRRGCCCRFICCVLVTVLLLAVLAAAALGALYLVFQPKAPRYSVDRLSVSQFQVDPTLTASARFDVTVTAANPNGRIGIFYERGSSGSPRARSRPSTRAAATRRCWAW